MGICAHKKDHEDGSLPQPFQPSASPQIFRKLIDLKKARKVPLLTLANNPLYLQRLEALKLKGSDHVSKKLTCDEKEESAN